VQLYIVRDGQRQELLGQTSVRVEEFLPDRMTIGATLSPSNAAGWVSPADLRAHVALRNLIGTPAAGNRIKATLRLSPSLPSFGAGPGGTSSIRWRRGRRSTRRSPRSRPTTPARRTSTCTSSASRKRRYRLRFVAEGFEAEGNRSVASDATALVSPLPYLVA
jgi:uncharacterized protein YfaS (alpha-2-macroglobulin family)